MGGRPCLKIMRNAAVPSGRLIGTRRVTRYARRVTRHAKCATAISQEGRPAATRHDSAVSAS
jgi:hypothetical protein